MDPARSSIGFTIRALFVLAPVRGALTVTAGTVVVADPVESSSLAAVAAGGSFDTTNSRRDHHVTSEDSLDADIYPDLTYQSTSLTSDSGGWVLRGQLTVRGTPAPLDFIVTALPATDPGTLPIAATGTADRITTALEMAGRRLRLTATATGL